jgi:MoaA/NifB/PqqE/SkfB family radical SAM enzyme
MFNYFDLFSQFYLEICKDCNLHCTTCTTSKSSDLQRLTYLIKNDLFFNYYPKKKIYNIIGGDPFMHPDIAYIVTFLQANNIKVFCWTNGLFKIENIQKVINQVNLFFIYLPTLEENEYTLLTGKNQLPQLLENISYLQEQTKKIIINFPITPQNIAFIPDIYNFAYYKNIHCLFHSNPKTLFTKNAKELITRFYNIKNVFVFKSQTLTKYSCQNIANITSSYQIIKNSYYELVNSIRKRFHL